MNTAQAITEREYYPAVVQLLAESIVVGTVLSCTDVRVIPGLGVAYNIDKLPGQTDPSQPDFEWAARKTVAGSNGTQWEYLQSTKRRGRPACWTVIVNEGEEPGQVQFERTK